MKWEYKTSQFVNHKDFDVKAVALGEDGWEVVKVETANGWTVGYFKRPVSGLASIDELVAILSNPEATKKALEDLQAAHEQNSISSAELKTAKKKYEEDVKSLSADKTWVADEIQKLLLNQADFQACKNDFSTMQKVHAGEKASHAVAVQAEKDHLQADVSRHLKVVEAHKASVSQVETALKAREATVSQRENSLAAREALVSSREKNILEINTQAEALVNRVRRQ